MAREIRLPEGYHVVWGGSFENMQRAMALIRIIVPLTIVVIFLLLFSSFSSLKQAALIICNLPFALIGGIVALWVTGEYLSVPASVGFINLFGVAVLNGIVLVSYMNSLRRQEGIEHSAGGAVRLRAASSARLDDGAGRVTGISAACLFPWDWIGSSTASGRRGDWWTRQFDVPHAYRPAGALPVDRRAGCRPAPFTSITGGH